MPIDPQRLRDALADPALAAMNDADAATALCADLRTVVPIPLAALRPWMNDNGLSSRLRATFHNPDGTLGAVFSGVCAAVGKDPLSTSFLVADALNFIANGGEVSIESTDPARGGKTYGLLQLMVAIHGQAPALGLSGDEAAAFLAFGGGLRFGPGSVAEADVAAARAYADSQAVYGQWHSYCQGVAAAGTARLDAAVNAGTALPTLEQLKAG